MNSHSKTCNYCGIEQPLKEFHNFRNKCKSCIAKTNKLWRNKRNIKIERNMPFDWIWEKERTIFESNKRKTKCH